MHILITFCNTIRFSDYYAELRLSQIGLLHLETNNLHFLKIPPEVNTVGFTGAAQNDKYIFVVSQEKRNPQIIRYDKENLERFLVVKAGEIHDPHSMIAKGKKLYVVSSGTNSIETYNTRTLSYLGKYWQHPQTGTEEDEVHINSIFESKGKIWVSAFGRKTTDRWSTAENGYLINTGNNRKLYMINHPHSATDSGKDKYYCESRTGLVYKNGKTVEKISRAYVRGLTVVGDLLAVGVSSSRKKSRSLDVVNNPSEKGKFRSVSGIMLYKKGKRSFCDLSPYFREIYDLMIIDGLNIALPQGVIGVTSVEPSAKLRENHLVSLLINEKEALMKDIEEKDKNIAVLQEQLKKKEDHLENIMGSILYRTIKKMRQWGRAVRESVK